MPDPRLEPFTERPYVVGSGMRVGIDAGGAFFFEGYPGGGSPTPHGNMRWVVTGAQAEAFFCALEALKGAYYYQHGIEAERERAVRQEA